MEHGGIRSVRCGDKKTDESFMHLIIENVVQKCLRDLIVEIHPPLSNICFLKPEMNVKNGCLFPCFILFNSFAAISID